ncbi:MAG: sulfatase, partial [Planctomycetota bacterium]
PRVPAIMMPSRVRPPILFAILAIFATSAQNLEASERPNFLLITVDDMSCDSVGAFGCELPDTTPNIDALARSGIKYAHAHVQVGNCFPSRNVMWSGLYPHQTNVEGFYQVRDSTHAHLVDAMKEAGYFVGIRGKVAHSTPYQPYAWDEDLTRIDGKTLHIKDVASYGASTARGIALAQEVGKPFCININISDPHKPFYGVGKNGKDFEDPHKPSRVFRADEVPIPGFLFDDPKVREELAQYYSSVRRADDCLGSVMKALKDSGTEEETVIIFLSDHGMPLPFAKTALWHHSTHTPLIVRWPGVTEGGTVDSKHMVSAVDLLPTILEIAGEDVSNFEFSGRSFASTLRGDSQDDRDFVFKVYNENSGGNRSPMRSIQTKRFGYLFNPYADGKRIFRTATTGTKTFRAMKRIAESDKAMAARLEFFVHGVPEEFYDYQSDPDALNNLIDDPAYQDEIKRHRRLMRQIMEETNDHALEAFLNREKPAFVSAYVDKKQAEADARRKKKKKK